MNPSRGVRIGLIVVVIILAGLLLYVLVRPKASPTPVQTATTTAPVATGAPLHLTEHAPYYDIDTQYPSSTSLSQTASAAADAAAVAQMKQWETDAASQFKTDSDLDNLTPEDIQAQQLGGDRKYTLGITYETYQSAHTVSYVYTMFEDTLGAHPNTTYKTFVFDATTGKLISLPEVFTSGSDYATTLSALSRAKLPAQIATAEETDVSQVDMDMLDAGTTADASNFQDFYFDGANFVIMFPPYQVGPYALGPVTLTVPASEVTGLNSAYP